MANNSLSARVVKAMTLFGGVKIFEILCAVVRNKLLAVLVGPAGVGLNAIFNRALELVAGISQLNLRQSSVRDISAAPAADRSAIITAVLWWALRLGIIGALLMLVCAPGFAWFSFESVSSWWMFALVGVAVLLQSVINGDLAVMQATDRLKSLAKCQIWSALTTMIGCVGCYAAFGLQGVVPGLVLSYVFSYFVTRYCRGGMPVVAQSRKKNVEIGKRFLGLGFSLGIGVMVSAVCAYAFIAWITRRSGETATGIFQAGYMLIINYAGLVFTAISMEFYPRLVKVADRPKFVSTLVSHEISTLLLVLIPIIAIFIPSAKWIIHILYTGRFMAALPMVTIGICGIVFRAVSFCMAFVIIARGDGKKYIITESVSSLIGLALNIIMYEAAGFAGLGVSYVIWYALYSIIVYIPCRKYYNLRVAPQTVRLIGLSLVSAAASYGLNLIGWWASVILATICAAFSAQYLFKMLFSRQ